MFAIKIQCVAQVVIIFLLLMGPVHPATGGGKNCTDLRIMDDEDEVNNGDCILFDNCNSDVSTLPDHLWKGLSVDGPRDFQIKTFVEEDYYYSLDNSTYVMPGIRFIWKVPASGISRSGTKGYWLLLKQVNSNNVVCRVFDLSRYNLRSPNIFFLFTLFPLNYSLSTSFVVQINSLPPPSEAEIIQDSSGQRSVSIPAAQKKEAVLNPDQWTTWINLATDPKRGSVKVIFGFADRSFGFEEYKVRLNTAEYLTTVKEASVFQVHTKLQGEYIFENIESGNYVVSVTPEEVYPGDHKQCVCYSIEVFGRNCRPCTKSVTSEFEIRGKSTPLTGMPTISFPSDVNQSSAPAKHPSTTLHPQKVTSKSSTASTEKLNMSEPYPSGQLFTKSTPKPTFSSSLGIFTGTEQSGPSIAGAAVGGVALVALLLFTGCWFWRKKQTAVKKNDSNNSRSVDSGLDHSSVFFQDVDVIEPDLTPSCPVSIQQKRVLLLAAEDHVYHIQAVERFANFLSVHCRCNVSFAPQCLSEIQEQNSYCWLSSIIDHADYVLIITSKAARCLYLAFQKGLSYRRDIFGPHGDLFTPGIQHICGMIARNVSVHKILTVQFEYTTSNYHLPIAALPSFVYQLPRHLSSLLQHIHKLNKHSMEMLKGSLPLECSPLDLLEGRLWMEAIEKAKSFEKNHINWFEERFDKPVEISKSIQQVEDDSGYNTNSFHTRSVLRPVHHVSSVSLSDICVCEMEDNTVQNFSITKDDFFEPSMYSTFTVMPTSSCLQEEIDDTESFLSKHMHKFNQQYEEQLQIEQSFPIAHSLDQESPIIHQQHLQVPFSETIQKNAQGFSEVLVNHENVSPDSITVLSSESV
ncbi:uncharacterized protein LOC112569687 isoform X1 [Pomacea canaliculata]|uniref:uncharacterized protein LOC112569687 isoform X1 n=2 Tax=Pomacea canaliculata TaxID=400727 RepID=UPI000D7335DB|nr:uncharacterized protein LOC112569687 isoform X1 [Pomacea canaliculata]